MGKPMPWRNATATYGYEDKSFETDRRRANIESWRWESDPLDPPYEEGAHPHEPRQRE